MRREAGFIGAGRCESCDRGDGQPLIVECYQAGVPELRGAAATEIGG
jgi:hypothetical protein